MTRLRLFACAALLLAPVLFSQDGHIPFATDFDGSLDLFFRTTELTGMADGKTGLVSVWIRVDGAAATPYHFLTNDGGSFTVDLTSSDLLRIIGFDSALGEVLRILTTTQWTASDGWFHLMASWDLANDNKHLYVNDSDELSELTFVDNEIDYARGAWQIGAVVGIQLFDGALAELYFTTEYLDLSIETNRRKFINGDLRPVDLGPSGHKPTGTAAIVYMCEQFNGFGQNCGTGGEFTPNNPVTSTAGPVPILPQPGRVGKRSRWAGKRSR